jgi:hypothetical protein
MNGLRINIRTAGNRVLVNFAGVFGVDWHWRKVDEFRTALRHAAEHARAFVAAEGGKILAASAPAQDFVAALGPRLALRSSGARVLLLLDARQGFECGPAEALALWEGLGRAARQAEERDAIEQVIYDQALLTRIGAGFGLTNDPALLAAAGNEAAWNRELRRALPGGVRSGEAVGTPTLTRGPGPTKH